LLDRCSANVLVAFGIGEAADLLRAYAPRVWSKVALVTCDGGGNSYAGLPVIDYRLLSPNPLHEVILAVRASIQPSLAERLSADGHRVVRWDDLLSEG
jgi:hypothetical protein